MDSTSSTQKDGIALIAAERQRQLSVEGWTPEHDDRHEHGELAEAGAAYVLAGKKDDKKTQICTVREVALNSPRGLDDIEERGERAGFYPVFPWDDEWWKPSDYLRNLVKGGALISAEIDRLLRKESKADSVSDVGSFDASRVSLQKQIESLLAACKAKDEALKEWKIVFAFLAREKYLSVPANIDWPKMHMLTEDALALQPDSSVKPEQTLGEKEPHKASDARPTEVPYEGDCFP